MYLSTEGRLMCLKSLPRCRSAAMTVCAIVSDSVSKVSGFREELDFVFLSLVG